MYIKKKILPFLLLFIILAPSVYAVTQDSQLPPAVPKPDLVLDNQEQEEQKEPDTYVEPLEDYSSFMIELLKADYLYNLSSNPPVSFQKTKKLDWSSLFSGSGSFLYAIRINQSRFAFSLGCGYSILYYAFAGSKEGDDTLYSCLKRTSEFSTDYEKIDNEPGKKYSYSAIKIPFIDFLFRLRFNSVLNQAKEGFHAWLGLKLGLHRPASMILRYEEYNDPGASFVQDGNFNLSPYSFGIQAGLGYHRFGLVGGFNLIPLFKDKEGPAGVDSLRPFSLAIYIDLI